MTIEGGLLAYKLMGNEPGPSLASGPPRLRYCWPGVTITAVGPEAESSPPSHLTGGYVSAKKEQPVDIIAAPNSSQCPPGHVARPGPSCSDPLESQKRVSISFN